MSGQITRKEIITDDAISWGNDYAKILEAAISKNKEFVASVIAINEANLKMRGSSNTKELAENQKKVNDEAQKSTDINKEQIALERQLTSLKEKNKLATSETAIAIAKERLEIASKNKEVKQGIQEETSAYAKLNNSRTQAKQKLLDLVAAQGLGTAEVKKAQAEFDKLDKKVKDADHSTGDFTKSVGNYQQAFEGALGKLTSFGGGLGNVTRQAIGFVQSGKEIGKEVQGINDKVVTTVKGFLGFGNAAKEAAVGTDILTASEQLNIATTEAEIVANETATVARIGFAQSGAGLAVANEAIAVTGTQATVATESLAVSQEAALITTSELAIAEGAAGVGAEALAVGAVGATAATEGLAVAEGTAAVATGVLDVALGILLAPVTLIVAALALLALVFKDFRPLINPIKDAFAGVGAVVSMLKGLFLDFATNIKSVGDLMSKLGDIILHPIDSLTSLGSSMKETAIEGAELNKAQRELTGAMADAEVQYKNTENAVKRLQLQARNRTLGEAERIKLQEKALELDKQLNAERKRNADKDEENFFKELEHAKILNEVQIATIKNSNTAELEKIKLKGKVTQDEINFLKQADNAYLKSFALKRGLSLKEVDFLTKDADERRIATLKSNSKVTSDQIQHYRELLANRAENESKTIASEEKAQNQINMLADKADAKRIKAKEETDKKAKKYEEDRIKRLEELVKSEFELEKQRLENTISINEEIAKDTTKSDSERVQALYDSQQAQEDLLIQAKQNALKVEKINNQKLLDSDGLTAKDRQDIATAHSNNIIRIEEDYSNKVVDINKKTKKEVDKINEFDSKSYEDNIKREIATVEIANNEEIAAEEKRFQDELALGYANDKAKEDAAKKHEKKLFEIKKEGLLAITRIQLANLSAELDAYEKKAKEDGKITQEESDYILAKRKELSDLSVRLIQAEGGEFTENEKNKTLTAKEQAEKILQISQELTGALSDLANAFSQAKIQKIDDEISKNNEFYDKQIALAENDARKKDFLEKERARKNDILEKKKREAQRKQAIFEKAVTVTQIALSTALAVIKAYTEGDPYTKVARSILAATTGAIQLAAALATPIPKYKHGRKGGPAELAIVGDGGVSEIITSGDGSNPRLTPNVPTLTKLGKDDIVHKSMSDYENYVKQSIILNFKNENQKIKELNSGFENNFSKELLEEMKRNTRAIEKGKPIILGNKPIDIPHSIWAFRNINWRA